MNTGRKQQTSLARAFLFFVTTSLIAGCSSILVTVPPSLQVAMDNAALLRSQAERKSEWLKLAKSREKISNSDYRRSRLLYADARLSLDLWINNVKAKLIGGKPVGDTDDYPQFVNTVADKSTIFNDYVNGLISGESRDVSGYTVLAFAKAAIDTIETIAQIDRQLRLELALKLEKLRWKSFDEI